MTSRTGRAGEVGLGRLPPGRRVSAYAESAAGALDPGAFQHRLLTEGGPSWFRV